jgi:hypothetical protein
VSLKGKRFPSPSIAVVHDLPKTGKGEVIGKDIRVIGGSTVEQPPPRSRGVAFIQVEHIPPSRIFKMHRMQHRVGYV